MSDVFDPYYKWLAIRDKNRPPNHYRLLGLELFEDDPDVISAAADQRIAHVRTYQLGPHSVLSQKILNELASAKLCLLEPKAKANYDRKLGDAAAAPLAYDAAVSPRDPPRAAETEGKATAKTGYRLSDDTPPAAEPAGAAKLQVKELPPTVTPPKPIALSPRRTTRAIRVPRRSMITWSIAAVSAAVIIIGLVVVWRWISRDRPDVRATAELPQEIPHFSPRGSTEGESFPQAKNPPSYQRTGEVKAHDSREGIRDDSPVAVSEPENSESFRPKQNRFADLAAELPRRLRSSWESGGPAKPESDVLMCHEIAQLGYANLALAALLRAPANPNAEEEITRAIAKIDEFNLFEVSPFVELVASGISTPSMASAKSSSKAPPRTNQSAQSAAKSWGDVDRCFDAYASAVARLRALLQQDTIGIESSEKVNQHVEQTETLFRAVLGYVRSNLMERGGVAEMEGVKRLSTIETAAAIDAFAAASAVQQICHWTLRICQTLSVYCGIARSENADQLKSITQQIYRKDFSSGLGQLRSLLLLELHLWAMLVQRET